MLSDSQGSGNGYLRKLTTTIGGTLQQLLLLLSDQMLQQLELEALLRLQRAWQQYRTRTLAARPCLQQ
jgi:hypothetical protein